MQKARAVTTRHGLAWSVGVASVAVGFWLLRRFEPTADSWFPKCMLHQLTGVHCPGCGATRAMRALAYGDLGLAIRCNALLVIGLPIALILVAWQRYQQRCGIISMPRLSLLFAVLFTLFMIIRNLPTPSTSWFAPPTMEAVKAEQDTK